MNTRLSEKECWELFRKYETPERVIRHCLGVRDAAVRIARELNKNGFDFDIDLISAAGLIHDVLRVQDCHGERAAELLDSLGYHDEAKIVYDHMSHKFPDLLSDATEQDMVCLGDRLVTEDRYQGLDVRIDYLIHKVEPTPERTAHLLEAKKYIRRFMDQVETAMGRTIDSLFAPTIEQILKQVEKPGRYIGGETNMVVKDPDSVSLRFAFAFPDLYEIGMSYMGMQILYDITNKMPDVYCERVFCPAPDMEKILRDNDIRLFTLETKTPVDKMDVIGFTLQYEMSFPTILDMLDLSGVPLFAKDRTDEDPLVIAGGPCAFNPEPLADFFDLFMAGDGEETLPNVLSAYSDAKKNGLTKREFFERISTEPGVYIPSFYEPIYNDDGTIAEYRKTWDGAPDRVKKAMINDLDNAVYPTKPLIPLVEAVHDRMVVETFRGCTRGCRFCQAGMIYRPVRERSKEEIMRIAKEQIESTGHDEMSILSLSTSDYSDFEGLATQLMEYCSSRNVALSLPSLRLDSFSFKVLDEIQKYKKSGLTFAPEAGTQRLRDVINKGITEDDIFSAVRQAIDLGWRHVKLYFMDGLPTETDEDIKGIGEIAGKIMDIFRASGARGHFSVTASVSNFVPKANTPFQWVGQCPAEEFNRKHKMLAAMKIKGVRITYHDDETSRAEAIFARGDRRTGQLILAAHKAGCRLDAWGEYYDREKWRKLLEDWEIDYRFYTERERSFDEILPWDIIDSGVSKEFLKREAEKAMRAETTHDCRYGCTGCGLKSRIECPMDGSLK